MEDRVGDGCAFENSDAAVLCFPEQYVVHDGATQAERGGSAEPSAWDVDVMTTGGVEDGFGECGGLRGGHGISNAEALEVLLAFGRNKFAAQFRSRKFLLFDE